MKWDCSATVRACVAAVTVLGAAALPTAAFAAATVHPLSVSLTALIQEDNGELSIAKVKVVQEDLVNLVLGAEVGTPVPGNLILALVVDCNTGDSQIVVFNTNTSSIVGSLAGEANLVDNGVLATKNGDPASLAFVLLLGATSSATLDSGGFTIAGLAKIGDGGCPTGAKLSILGQLVVVVEGEELNVLIAKGKAKAGKPIAILVD